MSTERGKQKWRDFSHSVDGKKRVALVSVAVFFAVAILLHLFISSTHGYCEKEGKYHTDEEYIRVALKGNIRLLTYPNEVKDPAKIDKIITNFLSKNPDCCKVFWEWDDELRGVSWLTWSSMIIVRIRNEKSLNAHRHGEKIVIDDGAYYATVDNCLGGSKVINELIPGG